MAAPQSGTACPPEPKELPNLPSVCRRPLHDCQVFPVERLVSEGERAVTSPPACGRRKSPFREGARPGVLDIHVTGNGAGAMSTGCCLP